jgi:Ca2+-binding RTX toxin-like protein
MFGKRRFSQVGIALLLGGACACGEAEKAAPVPFDPAGYEGFTETQFDLLHTACTVDGTTGEMDVTVETAETAYLYRGPDGKVTVNANNSGLTACATDANKVIKVTFKAGSEAAAHKVVVDFYTGVFGISGTTTPNLQIDLGIGTTSEVDFRTTPFADTFTLGTDSGTSTTYANLAVAGTSNTLFTAAAHAFADVSMKGVSSIMVTSGAGNDIITGQGGTSTGTVGALSGAITLTVYGGAGDDTITSGATSIGVVHNILNGGDGNDVFPQVAGALASDTIWGGAGTDTVDYSARTIPVSVTLAPTPHPDLLNAAGTLNMVANAAPLAAYDNFTIKMDAGATHKRTFVYQTTVTALDPNDVKYPAGTPVLIDVENDDTAVKVAARTVTAITGAYDAATFTITATQVTGTPIIRLTNTTPEATATGVFAITKTQTTGTGNFTFTGMKISTDYDDGDISGLEGDSIEHDVENVIGTAGADIIDASGVNDSTQVHVLIGLAGDDVLRGSGAADYLYGGPGNDKLYGNAGIDYLFGGDNDDLVQGGLGSDIIDGDGVNCVAAVSLKTAPIVPFVPAVCTANYAKASTTAGVNTLDYSDRTAALYVDLTNLTDCKSHFMGDPVLLECDKLVTSGTPAAASVINLRGGTGNDTLIGDARANTIWGGAGNDTIKGGLGNDILYGEAGDDTIWGNNGTNAALTAAQLTAGVTDDDHIIGGPATTSGGQHLNGEDGLDTVDSSQGNGDVVTCGLGDGDIWMSGGGSTNAATDCEISVN